MAEVQRQSAIDRINAIQEQQTPKSDIEDRVVLRDKEGLRSHMVSCLEEGVDPYLAIPNQPADGNKSIRKIDKVIIDDAIPLSMTISKGYLYSDTGEYRCAYLAIDIQDGSENSVAEFGLRDYGDEFRCSHRKVNEKYQKNGIGKSGILAIEAFVKRYAQKTGRKPIINVNAAQLDVISLFAGNDFQTTQEQIVLHAGENEMTIHKLDDVLTSLEKKDGLYAIGPYGYIFPGDFTGPKILKEGSPEGVNIDFAATIHLKKELDLSVEPAEKQSRMQTLIRRVRREIRLRRR